MKLLTFSQQIACLSFLASLFFAVPSGLSAAEPVNVVLILGDDQAWTDFGFMGHPVIQTPHFDKFAQESAVFTNGYVPTSLCRPSLATLISGRYPHEHKITGNDPPKGTPRGEMLRHIRQLPTLPKWLGERGYVSFQTGKWWEGAPAEGGFTSGMTHGDPARGGRHGDLGLKISREGHEPIAKFLDSVGTKPFFLWHAPFLPHSPHNPPARLLAKYQQPDRPLPVAKYYAMCEWFDETVGDLLRMLDERGLTKNTLVVFANDNGWIQDPQSPAFAPKSKRSPYDGGLRTPILVRWPGQVAPARIATPVSTIDVAPTILAACGIQPPADLPGVNLLAVLQQPSQPPRTLYGEIFEHDLVDLDDPASSLLSRWTLVDARWKLIQPANPSQPPELYDVQADPHEEHNLASQEPQRVRDLQQTLDAWWSPKRQ